MNFVSYSKLLKIICVSTTLKGKKKQEVFVISKQYKNNLKDETEQ